jgi:putative membrane protein
MTFTRRALLLAGALLFIVLIGWQGLPALFSTLSLAGAGLLLVALFHALPLVLDAAALRVFFRRGTRGAGLLDTVLTRWVGESVNSLMPAGQLGGPLVMIRQLTQRGVAMAWAAATVTVSTTFQLLGQVLFALMGVALIGTKTSAVLLVCIAVMGTLLIAFYLMQRRGLFGTVIRLVIRYLTPGHLHSFTGHAEAFDCAVRQAYERRVRSTSSFGLSLFGWVVGTGEVYLILRLIRAPVSWKSALLLESLGQAIRGAAFAIPGSLGVQEGGYLLLAPLAGLSPEAALAMSLAKRARELLLGVPGLLYLHFFERRVSLPAAPGRPFL